MHAEERGLVYVLFSAAHSSPGFTTPNTQSAQKYTKHPESKQIRRKWPEVEKEKMSFRRMCAIGAWVRCAICPDCILCHQRGAADASDLVLEIIGGGHSSITIYGPAAGVFAWTRFIRPTSFISSIDWISSSSSAVQHSQHTARGQRTKNICVLRKSSPGRKIPSARMDHLATHATLCDGAYLVPPMLFDFVDDLSHLTLLYGERTLLICPARARDGAQHSWIIHYKNWKYTISTECGIFCIAIIPCDQFNKTHMEHNVRVFNIHFFLTKCYPMFKKNQKRGWPKLRDLNFDTYL